MAQTRSSLANKIETLENKVVHGVENAGAAVEKTVDKVLDTVEHATANVGETITKVTSTVGGAVESVKSTVNTAQESVKSSLHTVRERISIACQVRHHPWLMMGGAVAVGYMLDHLLEPSRYCNGHASLRHISPRRLSSESTAATGEDVSHGQSTSYRTDYSQQAPSHGESKSSSIGSFVSHLLAPHAKELRGLAIGSLMSMFRNC